GGGPQRLNDRPELIPVKRMARIAGSPDRPAVGFSGRPSERSTAVAATRIVLCYFPRYCMILRPCGRTKLRGFLDNSNPLRKARCLRRSPRAGLRRRLHLAPHARLLAHPLQQVEPVPRRLPEAGSLAFQHAAPRPVRRSVRGGAVLRAEWVRALDRVLSSAIGRGNPGRRGLTRRAAHDS